MITPKAKELARKARILGHYPKGSPEHIKAIELADIITNELIKNCNPTRKEFSDLMVGIIVTPSNLWDLVLQIPIWNDENRTDWKV